jgi:hypothetical protein
VIWMYVTSGILIWQLSKRPEIRTIWNKEKEIRKQLRGTVTTC